MCKVVYDVAPGMMADTEQVQRSSIMNTKGTPTLPVGEASATSPATPPQPLPEKTQPSRRGNWRPVLILMLVVLLVFVGSAIALIAINFPITPKSSLESHTLTVKANPQIVVSNDVGTIHVNGSSLGNEVTIKGTKWQNTAGANLDNIHMNYKQNADENTITVNVERLPGAGDSNALGIDIDITVPHNTELGLSTTTGSIDVTGVSGQMSLKSNSGHIEVTESTLNGNSVLSTGTGSIKFDGAIERQTTQPYLFMSNSGSIDITLPADSAFHFDATNGTGTIISDYPGVTVKRLSFNVIEAHGYIGNPPRANVMVRSNIGEIHLYKGQ